jgi:hypothetical protein
VYLPGDEELFEEAESRRLAPWRNVTSDTVLGSQIKKGKPRRFFSLDELQALWSLKKKER